MKHQQILDKLDARILNEALDEELSRLMRKAMTLKKVGSIDDISTYVFSKIIMRWNCVLKAKNDIPKYYTEKVILALAVLFHKYGLTNHAIAEKAIAAIDLLNEDVVLSDDFYRKSDKIKEFLKSKPKELKRQPARIKNETFFRAKDMIAIHIENKYYVAYIHSLTGINEAPILEFYESFYHKKPTIESITSFKAKGEKFNDGKIRKALYAVYGMKHQPDVANQIHLIQSGLEVKMLPKSTHLDEPIGQFTVSDLYAIQATVKKMFEQ